MGFSPTLYGFSLHALAAGRAGAVRWMSMGLLAASTLLVVIFQFVDPENLMKVLKGRIDALLLTRWVDLGAAVLLGVCGTVLLVVNRNDRTRPPKEHRSTPEAHQGRRAFGFGFANTLIGFSGVATMYVVGRVASGVSPHLWLRVLAYLVFVVTLVGPYLLAAWAWGRYPRFAEKATGGYERLLHRDLRTPIAILILVVALAFALTGLWPRSVA